VAADLNADGRPDLAGAGGRYGDSVNVILGVGDGTFTRPSAYPVGHGPRALTGADFTGDGLSDLATANWTTASVLLNDGVWPALPPTVVGTRVNGGAAQRSRVTEITVTFNTLVSFAGGPANAAAAFRLTRIGLGGPAGDVTLAVDLSGSTAARTVARLTFSGPLTEFGSLLDGRYALTVLSLTVSAGGQLLDGDGDGVAGGDAVTALHRLYGDVTGDGTVNGADFDPFRLAFGAGVGNPNYVAALDFDGDGFVIGADFNEFRKRFGLSI
jgi:hypothetical protein